MEPQVFALLALLVGNSERLVSKDEIIEKVWDGRVVSDAAVASRVKSARQALGDDGKSQQFIKTIHGQGYRFVAQIRASQGVAASAAEAAGDRERAQPRCHGSAPGAESPDPRSRCCRFDCVAGDERYAALAMRCPDELITDLARLHWLLRHGPRLIVSPARIRN